MTNQHSQAQKEKEYSKKRIFTERITFSFKENKKTILEIDKLVLAGRYMSRSDFIRYAIRDLLKAEKT